MSDQPIVFYDSDCGFCTGAVRFVLDHETTPRLRFAPLNGETAAQTGIRPELGLKTIIVHDNGKTYIRSRAIRHIMENMGHPWQRRAKWFSAIPAPLSDVGYRLVASVRRHLPGSSQCGILPPEHRQRFLP